MALTALSHKHLDAGGASRWNKQKKQNQDEDDWIVSFLRIKMEKTKIRQILPKTQVKGEVWERKKNQQTLNYSNTEKIKITHLNVLKC